MGTNELRLSPAPGDRAGASAFDLAGIARKLVEWIGGREEGGGEGVGEAVVVLEGFDLLLATGVVTAVELVDFVLGLHEVWSACFFFFLFFLFFPLATNAFFLPDGLG